MVALAVIATTYGIFKLKKSASSQTDVEVIYAYISRPRPYEVKEEDAYHFVIDTDFRTLRSNSKRSASEARITVIQKVLSQKLRPAVLNELNISCLAVPNTSKDLQTLRVYAEQAWGTRNNLILLTFSAPCVSRSGNTYYYVEQVFKGMKLGSADIYVLNNGVLEEEIPIWVN